MQLLHWRFCWALPSVSVSGKPALECLKTAIWAIWIGIFLLLFFLPFYKYFWQKFNIFRLIFESFSMIPYHFKHKGVVGYNSCEQYIFPQKCHWAQVLFVLKFSSSQAASRVSSAEWSEGNYKFVHNCNDTGTSAALWANNPLVLSLSSSFVPIPAKLFPFQLPKKNIPSIPESRARRLCSDSYYKNVNFVLVCGNIETFNI